MSAQKESQKRLAAPDISAMKGKTPIVCLTAYTAPMAELLDPVCDILLVGDSVGMVVHGLDNTVGVTLEMMILHGQDGQADAHPHHLPANGQVGQDTQLADRLAAALDGFGRGAGEADGGLGEMTAQHLGRRDHAAADAGGPDQHTAQRPAAGETVLDPAREDVGVRERGRLAEHAAKPLLELGVRH